VAISGDMIVVGTQFEASSTTGVGSTPNELAQRAGAAYVFRIIPDMTPPFTITRSAVVFNRATGRFSQTVTLVNYDAALDSAALVLDDLPAGVALHTPSGFTNLAAPAGSPYRELGAIDHGATVSVTLEFTRTGTQPITYTPRVLGAGLR
jgi:hypothetical protein